MTPTFPSSSTGATDLAFGLYAVISLITNPYLWEHYNVVLLLPWLLALRPLIGPAAPSTPPRRHIRIIPLALLSATAALLSLNIHRKTELWSQAAAHFPPAIGLHFQLHLQEILSWLSPLLLLSALALLLASSRPNPRKADA